METVRPEILLADILDHPEDVLYELGTDDALALVKRLAATDPATEAVLKDCQLVKLIESGFKFATGKIITEEESEND